MTVLIVDDDRDKRSAIAHHVGELYANAKITERASYQSGCQEAIQSSPDIILLDMTLPTYDVSLSEGETGGRHRPYGGRDVLRELDRKGSTSSVIIVTQYDMFSDGNNVTLLSDLKQKLALEFPVNYVGAVFFQSSSSSWRDGLAGALSKTLTSKGLIP